MGVRLTPGWALFTHRCPAPLFPLGSLERPGRVLRGDSDRLGHSAEETGSCKVHPDPCGGHSPQQFTRLPTGGPQEMNLKRRRLPNGKGPPNINKQMCASIQSIQLGSKYFTNPSLTIYLASESSFIFPSSRGKHRTTRPV